MPNTVTIPPITFYRESVHLWTATHPIQFTTVTFKRVNGVGWITPSSPLRFKTRDEVFRYFLTTLPPGRPFWKKTDRYTYQSHDSQYTITRRRDHEILYVANRSPYGPPYANTSPSSLRLLEGWQLRHHSQRVFGYTTYSEAMEVAEKLSNLHHMPKFPLTPDTRI